jgi:hypothetical protein
MHNHPKETRFTLLFIGLLLLSFAAYVTIFP